MVQQLSLVSSIDEDSLDVLLTTLSSLSGTPHIGFGNINLIYKPSNINESTLDNIDIQTEADKQQNRIKLSTSAEDGIDITNLPKLMDDASLGWSLSTSDVPLAGNSNKEISSQAMYETLVSDSENGMRSFMDSLGYTLDYAYALKGFRVFHHQMMITCDVFKTIQLETNQEYTITQERDITPKGYIVKCYSNVEQTTDIENITKATADLVQFKKILQKYIDLRIPERKNMDSRIKDY